MTATLIAGTSVARWTTPALGGVGPAMVTTRLRRAVLATRMQQDYDAARYAAS